MAIKSVCTQCTFEKLLKRPVVYLDTNFRVSRIIARALASSASLPPRGNASHPTNTPSNHIAVLGGGVTGLATTTFLKWFLPDAKVTLIEAGPRVGGWVQSSQSRRDGHEIIFEQGPRSLRPSFNAAGLTTLLLVRLLQLSTEVVATRKDSPASVNRFVYYKDHLLRLPHPSDGLGLVASMFSPPIYNDVTRSIWGELWKPGRSDELKDETIGSFFRRRFSNQMTDNFVSAGIHGVYAGNVDKLSMKTIFPALWDVEARYGSLGRSMITKMTSIGNRRTIMPEQDFIMLQLLNKFHYARNEDPRALFGIMTLASLFTIRGGLETLTKCMEALVQKHERFNSGVTVKLGTKVSELRPSPTTAGSTRVYMTGKKNSEQDFTHIISALPAKALLSALHSKNSSHSTLQSSEVRRLSVSTVTVMVVNLYYDNFRLPSKPGFGYLLPQSLDYEQNPELALGVVFDSEATVLLDSASASGTKLTVMLGGHWWDGWTAFPSEEDGIRMARSLLRRQLGIEREPTLAKATLQRDCIPQYEVGHAERAAELSDKIERVFGRRFDVVGASWSGVSVNDCIKSAFKAAWNATGNTPQFDIMHSVDWTYQSIREYPAQEVYDIVYGGKIIRGYDEIRPR